MKDSNFKKIVERRNQSIRDAKYCDFNREDFIKRFSELPLKTQKLLMRQDFRRKRFQKPLERRLREFKEGKDFINSVWMQ